MRRFICICLMLVALPTSLPAALAEGGEPSNEPQATGESSAPPPPPAGQAQTQSDFDSARARLLARIKERWSDQIQRSAKIEDEEPLDLTGADGSPAVHAGYKVTEPRSPLIGEDCRAESLADALAHWSQTHPVSEDEAFADREAHIRELQGRLGKGATFSAWIGHVAQCKDFCLIAVRDLLACHVQAVGARPHALVFFGLDSDRIEAELGSGAVEDFAARLRESANERILLIGRASRLGAAGPSYNRDLSRRRTLAVRNALVERGVPEGRIGMQAIGYEEPQLTREIAEIYGIVDQLERLGESGINQSVVMVVY